MKYSCNKDVKVSRPFLARMMNIWVVDEDVQNCVFLPSKAPVKSILLTWYLLISFGHAQHSGRKIEDDTESTSTAVNAPTDLLMMDIPGDDTKTSESNQSNSVARGNSISPTKKIFINRKTKVVQNIVTFLVPSLV